MVILEMLIKLSNNLDGNSNNCLEFCLNLNQRNSFNKTIKRQRTLGKLLCDIYNEQIFSFVSLCVSLLKNGAGNS